jgi:tetratricopeptide (TPR) repeat protein
MFCSASHIHSSVPFSTALALTILLAYASLLPGPARAADEIPGQSLPPAAPDPDRRSIETFAEVLGRQASPVDMADAQIRAKEFGAARRVLEQAITALETASLHRYEPELIRPLALLGDALMGEGDYLQALDQYQRAAHLARVNNGLKSAEQVELVYREAEALKALGQQQEASHREEFAYQVLASRAGPGDESLLVPLYRLADWYLTTNNPFAARELYERAARIIDANQKLSAPDAIPALQGLAWTYRLERFPLVYSDGQNVAAGPTTAANLQQPVALNNFPAGEQALQQIVRIQQQADPPDPIAVTEAVLELADWYTLFDRPRRANPLYAHAYETLAQLPDADVIGYFAEPKLLYLPEPGNPRRNRPGPRSEPQTGFVEVAYDVSETGQVRNLATIASEPAGVMDLRVRRSLRVARYRPVLVDGVPVVRSNHTYRHEFPYWLDPEPDADDPPAEVVQQ